MEKASKMKTELAIPIFLLFLANAQSQQCPSPNWRFNHFPETETPSNYYGCDHNAFISGFFPMSDDKGVIDPRRPICSPVPCLDSSLPIITCMEWDLEKETKAACPSGQYLQSIIIPEEESETGLGTLSQMCCAKIVITDDQHDSCIELDVQEFSSRGDFQCKPGYYINGLQRRSCTDLPCLRKLKCCKPPSQAVVVDSDEKLITKSMAQSLPDLALLAHCLGYNQCSGSGSPYVGEDFLRDGNTWRVAGAESDHDFNIHFDNFKIISKDMHYGETVTEEITPREIETGIEDNTATSTPSTRVVRNSETTEREVTHTTTSEWKTSLTHGLQIRVTYQPGLLTGHEVTSGYTFGYEDSSSKTDSTGKVQTKTFDRESTKEVPAGKIYKYTFIVNKVKYSVDYTTDICLSFSVEFRGSLRTGSDTGNLHVDYHDSKKNVGFDYRFGNENQSFYEALESQKETLQEPWLWNKLVKRYPNFETLISQLTTEMKYCIKLSGRFEDVQGYSVYVKWEDVTNPVTGIDDPVKPTTQSPSTTSEAEMNTTVSSTSSTPDESTSQKSPVYEKPRSIKILSLSSGPTTSKGAIRLPFHLTATLSVIVALLFI